MAKIRKLNYSELSGAYAKIGEELGALRRDHALLNKDLNTLLQAINILGEESGFEKAHEFLMQQIPIVKVP